MIYIYIYMIYDICQKKACLLWILASNNPHCSSFRTLLLLLIAETTLICTPLCYALILYLAQMFMRPIGSKGHLVFAMCQNGIAASYNLNYIYRTLCHESNMAELKQVKFQAVHRLMKATMETYLPQLISWSSYQKVFVSFFHEDALTHCGVKSGCPPRHHNFHPFSLMAFLTNAISWCTLDFFLGSTGLEPGRSRNWIRQSCTAFLASWLPITKRLKWRDVLTTGIGCWSRGASAWRESENPRSTSETPSSLAISRASCDVKEAVDSESEGMIQSSSSALPLLPLVEGAGTGGVDMPLKNGWAALHCTWAIALLCVKWLWKCVLSV